MTESSASPQRLRNQILQLIKDHPGDLGPADIAEKLGSTSKSIAVTICHMRTEGYHISRCRPGTEVTPGSGYRLLEEPE